MASLLWKGLSKRAAKKNNNKIKFNGKKSLAPIIQKRGVIGGDEEYKARVATIRRAGQIDHLPSYLTSTPETKVTQLDNNIRVATEDSPHAETATIGVWIDAGSAYENEDNNGTAHFLEHMAFKGTNKRTQQQLELEVENMGAQLNAYTSREQTVYVGRCFKEHIPTMVDILSDILQNSNFKQEHIERERDVILKEKEDVERNLEEVVFDYLHSAVYQGTPLEKTILGSEHNIKSIQRDHLTDFISTHYTGPRMVVAGAGATHHDDICSLVSKSFKDIPSENKFDYNSLDPVVFTGSEVRVTDNPLKHVYSAIGFESVGWTHPDFYVFLLQQALIGSWDKSMGGSKYLVSNLAEHIATGGMLDSFTTFNTCYNQSGIFGIYFEGPPHFHHKHEEGPDGPGKHGEMQSVVNTIMREFHRIGQEGLAKGELDRAKNKLKSSILMQLDDTSSICEDIGRNVVALGRRPSPAEIFMRIEAITYDDIYRVSQEYFYDVDPGVVAIGSIADFPQYPVLRWKTRPAWT